MKSHIKKAGLDLAAIKRNKPHCGPLFHFRFSTNYNINIIKRPLPEDLRAHRLKANLGRDH